MIDPALRLVSAFAPYGRPAAVPQRGRPAGGSIRIDAGAAAWRTAPAAARLADGSIAVIWQSDQGSSGTGYEIRGRRVTPHGFPLGAELRIDASPSVAQGVPRVAAGAGGGFLVVWESRSSWCDRAVFVRAFDSKARPLGPPRLAHRDAALHQGDPDVVADADGGFLGVWSTRGPDRDATGLWLRRFAADGEPLADPRPLGGEAGRGEFPALAAVAPRTFALAWSTSARATATDQLHVRLLGTDSDVAGPELRVDADASPRGLSAPVVSPLAGGGFLVLWAEHSPRACALRARRFDTAARPAAAAYLLAPEAAALSFAAAAGPEGALFVTWTDPTATLSAQRFAPDGRALGARFELDRDVTSGAHLPCVVADGTGGWVLVWQSFEDGLHDAAIRLLLLPGSPSPRP